MRSKRSVSNIFLLHKIIFELCFNMSVWHLSTWTANAILTCHSLQSSWLAKRNKVTELYSCQNCERRGGIIFHDVAAQTVLKKTPGHFMLLMPSEDLVQSSWKVQSSNRSFILDTSRKTWKLTWPKNRKGKRNVSPLHIQDWNPSAETEKQSLVMFCFFGVLSLRFHCSTAWRLRCLRKQICVIGAPACWDISVQGHPARWC